MEKQPDNDEPIARQTAYWVESVVIGCNFCPFAARVVENDGIAYRVVRATELQTCLEELLHTCIELDRTPAIETALIIYPDAFARFDDYLDMLDIAERLLLDQGYEGIYQLASFHPDYRFADAPDDDPANYTNRSPFPMLHLLREESLAQALRTHPDPGSIPQRNIEYAREQGLERMKSRLLACRRERK